MASLMVVVGDVSADRHTAKILERLKEKRPDLHVFGSGGPHMRATGMEQLFRTEEFTVIGIFEVVRSLPFFYRMRQTLLKAIDERKPDAVLLVDSGGFNIQFATAVRKRNPNLPIYYFISPQIWASRPWRVLAIRKAVSKMLTVFPFEEPIYLKQKVPARFVGHYLMHDLPDVKSLPDREEFIASLGLDPKKPVIAVLPGSRRQEVKLHMPIVVQAMETLMKLRPDVQFIVSKATERVGPLVEEALKARGLTALEGLKAQDCPNNPNALNTQNALNAPNAPNATDGHTVTGTQPGQAAKSELAIGPAASADSVAPGSTTVAQSASPTRKSTPLSTDPTSALTTSSPSIATNSTSTGSNSPIATTSASTGSSPSIATNSASTGSTPAIATNSASTGSSPSIATNSASTGSTPAIATNSASTASNSSIATNSASTASNSSIATNSASTGSTPAIATNFALTGLPLSTDPNSGLTDSAAARSGAIQATATAPQAAPSPSATGKRLAIISGGSNFALYKNSDFIWAKSGTNTLEITLFGCPMLIFFKGNWFSYFLVMFFKTVKNVGWPNLLAGKPLVPELLQMDCRSELIVRYSLDFLDVPALAREIREELLTLGKELGSGDFVENCTEELIALLKPAALTVNS